jgi:hypothetical protein
MSGTKLKLPVALRALGDEIRALEGYFAHGLVTQEEADERIGHWGLQYPPGWYLIEILIDGRRDSPLPHHSQAIREDAA